MANVHKSIDLISNMKIPAIKGIHTSFAKTNSHTKTITKVPVLKITISKTYNKPSLTNKKESNPFPRNHTQYTNFSQKPAILDVVLAASEKFSTCRNAKMGTGNVYVPKVTYSRKGNLSRDHSLTRTPAERIRYLYTKAQRDCNVLQMRLKALKERYLREKEEIKRLHAHMGNYRNFKKYTNESSDEYSEISNMCISSEHTEGEDEKKEEYEKLLNKVKKIKRDTSQSEILTSNEPCFERVFVDTRCFK